MTQKVFELAYWRQNAMIFDNLGIDIKGDVIAQAKALGYSVYGLRKHSDVPRGYTLGEVLTYAYYDVK